MGLNRHHFWAFHLEFAFAKPAGMRPVPHLSSAVIQRLATGLLAAFACSFSVMTWVDTVKAAEQEPYVLLTNGNVLRGTAQVSGDLVILHRGDGSELKIRSTDVAYSAYDLRDVYLYRISRRQDRTPAMISEDAHWCLRQGLLDEAETELKKLEAADSGYPTLGRLTRQLAVARNPSTAASSPPEPASVTATASHAEPVKHEPPTANLSGVSSQSLVEFTSRLQPMLIKSCGTSGCHRTGGDTQWQLSHFGLSTRVSSRMTQLNLGATLAFASSEHPESSPILKYATTPHGKDYEATGRADLLTQQTLRSWLQNSGAYPQPHTPMAGAATVTPIASTIPGLPAASDMTTASNVVPTPRAVKPNWTQTLGTSTIGGRSLAHATWQRYTSRGFSIDENGEWIYDPDGTWQQTHSQRLRFNLQTNHRKLRSHINSSVAVTQNREPSDAIADR